MGTRPCCTHARLHARTRCGHSPRESGRQLARILHIVLIFLVAPGTATVQHLPAQQRHAEDVADTQRDGR